MSAKFSRQHEFIRAYDVLEEALFTLFTKIRELTTLGRSRHLQGHPIFWANEEFRQVVNEMRISFQRRWLAQ